MMRKISSSQLKPTEFKLLRKLPRSSLRAWTMGHLKSKQGGNCAVCGLPISLQVMGNKSDYEAVYVT